MTSADVLLRARSNNITLDVQGDRLIVDAPSGALTPELRSELARHKAELLAVLPRLAGMLGTVGQVPIPCARLEACGGPGRCFSCGDALDHPQAYGRCVPCGIASELFYAECPDAADRWQPAPVASSRERTR